MALWLDGPCSILKLLSMPQPSILARTHSIQDFKQGAIRVNSCQEYLGQSGVLSSSELPSSCELRQFEVGGGSR